MKFVAKSNPKLLGVEVEGREQNPYQERKAELEMIVRNLTDPEVLETTYLAHGGAIAQMVLDRRVLKEIGFLAVARLTAGKVIESHRDPMEEIYFIYEGEGEMTVDEEAWRRLLSVERLQEDLRACLNAAQLSRRRFRDIARVAGLIFPGYPGQARGTRHLQASSDLFFDVFCEHDPGNLLLEQARREVLTTQLEFARLEACRCRVPRACPG